MRRSVRITLSPEESALLQRWVTEPGTPARVRVRARILLGAALGRSNREIARDLDLDPSTVSFWRQRFNRDRLGSGLRDRPRVGREKPSTAAVSERIMHATRFVPPPHGPRWTTRTLARFLGVNHMQVHRTWKAGGVRLTKPTPEGPDLSGSAGVAAGLPSGATDVVPTRSASSNPPPEPGPLERDAPGEPPAPEETGPSERGPRRAPPS